MSKDPRPSPAGTTAIADLSYEDARDELVQIVARIEGGSASLEESMKLWERGESLAAHCQAKLDQAQAQLDGTAARAGDDSDSGAEDDSDDNLEDDAAERSDV